MSFINTKQGRSLSISTVCVYCGSSGDVSSSFKSLAKETGKALAERNFTVVYGGGHVGLMGIVADAALEHGAKVIGIIPQHIRDKEIQHTGLTELHVVPNMHTRKNMMAARADAFVILPGGLGTLDETFEILTWKKLGLHDKPIIIVNADGYWDPLLALIESTIKQGFSLPGDAALYKTVTNLNGMLEALAHETTPTLATDTAHM